jgi:hypothetical protein
MRFKKENLSYRFLTQEDLPIYTELFTSIQTMLKVPMREIQIERGILSYSNPNRKHVGAFDNNGKLIAIVTGHFYHNWPSWYCTNQYVTPVDDSLISHLNYIEIHRNSMKLLTNYAEEQGIFSFYIRRILSHQTSYEKLIALALKRGEIGEIRYDYLYDEIYGPVLTTEKMHHKFFFPIDITEPLNAVTVIILYSLKQQYRKDLLIKKHPEVFAN